jgi:tetratricopeptide (TPR) repeat protein
MFKVKTIVLSICTAFAAAGCASLEQFSDKAAEALGQRKAQHVELTADQWYARGKEYQSQLNYDGAIAAYLEALQRDHALADAHNAIGVVYAQQGQYNDAILEFTAAIELKPGEAYLHNNLGYALLMQGSNQQGLAALEIAVKLDPSNEKAVFNLRLAQQRLGLSENVAVAAGAAMKASNSSAARATQASSAPNDPRLVSLGSGVYELKLSPSIAPQVAALKEDRIEESPLSAPFESTLKIRPFKLEIANGNGTPGLARRVARVLDKNGIHANHITNHRTFNQQQTEIQYRKGYLSEASSLLAILPAEVKAVPTTSLRKDVQVRVVLGRDLPSITALKAPTDSTIAAAQSRESTSR